jgi:hypothetical protein
MPRKNARKKSSAFAANAEMRPTASGSALRSGIECADCVLSDAARTTPRHRTALRFFRLPTFVTCDPRGTAHYWPQGTEVELSSIVLTPVRQARHWRVKIAWPKKTPHFFGRFETLAEAERWIAKHHWMTEQRQEPDAAEADDPDDPDITPPDTP